ncbi:cytoplasmic polyadenylation element-binding protein 3 [Striga asiatica]|uniref:Cytoplasmic polyadenylation element-binding protein 3 n=1 Tax=Striga asiatica TaxID=4170 RepID=A0A5A7QKJ7_STRAF|nr:cytoplasmic polyadenylation element-binding protein 3 [Striga asiatica]
MTSQKESKGCCCEKERSVKLSQYQPHLADKPIQARPWTIEFGKGRGKPKPMLKPIILLLSCSVRCYSQRQVRKILRCGRKELSKQDKITNKSKATGAAGKCLVGQQPNEPGGAHTAASCIRTSD